MEILRTVGQALSWRRAQSKAPALVPTMGALHEGHASLMRSARGDGAPYAVSIFVNPAQFGPGEDFDRYPRSFEEDLEVCRGEGVSAVFCPSPRDMYSDRFSTEVSVNALSENMCGASRPGHFTGVATVVMKLINIIRPSRAYFGQKDYQQLMVIKRMVSDLNADTEVIMCPTVREDDGLALSSRNRYLGADERAQAPGLYAALKEGKDFVASGEKRASVINYRITKSINKNITLGRVDYAGVYDPETLALKENTDGPLLLAGAVFLGNARLIDNILANDN